MPAIKPLATLKPTCNSRTWHSAPHPTQPIIATSCSDKSARIYSLATFEQQSLISGGHKRSIRCCAWKPHNLGSESVLATGSFDASAGIWRRIEDRSQKAQEVDFTKGLAGGEDGDEEDEEEWRFAVILDGHDSEIKSLAFSPVAPLLATCSRDKSVWIWEELDDDNFETVAVLQDHDGDVKCVAWHPDEELLASGSYDDTVRLWKEEDDDWACCARLDGHKGTVWYVAFEPLSRVGVLHDPDSTAHRSSVAAGPRLLSSSDDGTIRLWRRVPDPNKPVKDPSAPKIPSIWKNQDFEEDWVQESVLPVAHERPVYAVAWSEKTGRVASTGSDGKVIIYEERRARNTSTTSNGDTAMEGQTPPPGAASGDASKNAHILPQTTWHVLATLENAHDVFEINHVAWAPRADSGKRFEGEEVLVTTGDDGEVKLWIVEDE